MTSRLTLLLAITISYSTSLTAQLRQMDTIHYQSAMTDSRLVYFNQLGDQSVMNNGSLYAEYPYSFRSGTPFYPSGDFMLGSVIYDGMRFDSVLLLYDQLRQFVVNNKDGYSLQLINERLAAFSIAEHRFIRLEAGSSNNGLSITGFYELLYSGRLSVFKLTIKDIQEETSSSEGVTHYIESRDNYFIQKGNVFLHIRSLAELMDIFSDHENEIRAFIKREKLSYKKDRDQFLIRVTAYYDQLKV